MHAITDGETVYPSINKDIHELGVKLAKKYKLIPTSYLVLVYGVISVFLFGWCQLMF